MTHLSAEFLDLQAALAGEYSLERELGRLIGEDLSRLAEAQSEVEAVAGRRLGATRTPTPA